MLTDAPKQLCRLTTLIFISLLVAACGGSGSTEEKSYSSTSASSESAGISSSEPISSSSSSEASSSQSSVDTTPPSATNLQIYKISATSITLKWQPAADNVAVSAYEIRRNDVLIDTVSYPASSVLDKGLDAGNNYHYTITTVDSSGNRSTLSAPLMTKTLPDLTLTIGSPANNKNNGISEDAGSPAIPTDTFGSSSSLDDQSANRPASSLANSSIHTTSSSVASSNPNISSAASSYSVSSQSSQALSSSSSSAHDSLLSPLLPKTYSWSHPTARSNGDYLELDYIGGYELRFKMPLTNDYVYLVIEGNRITSLATDLIPLNTAVEIAVYDINGLYSNFVSLRPQ